MPLVERYDDWNVSDRSFDDPHTLEFDHRVEADAASSGTGLVNVEEWVLPRFLNSNQREGCIRLLFCNQLRCVVVTDLS